MVRRPYPLQALRQLREDRAEAQALDLAAQVARSHAAEMKLCEAERARRDHAQRAAASLRAEQALLVEAGASGADLSRLGDFEAAMRARAALLERAEADARDALAKERAVEQKLRSALTEREAEAELVRKHEAAFRQREQEAVDKAEEEAALEQWTARHR